ncbi:MAG: Arc family DNA-binding protein [Coriobacteriia bacterium]
MSVSSVTKTEVGTIPNFLLRNMDPELMEQMRRRAKEHGRSLQAEIQTTLRRSLAREKRAAFLEQVDRFLDETRGREAFDATAAIRHDRDAGHKPWLGY